MVVQYLLVALVAFIASMDEHVFGITMLGRPLFTSLFVGLILGDVQQGVIVGAALESMFMGAIMVGAAVPPEVYASGVLGCAFAVRWRLRCHIGHRSSSSTSAVISRAAALSGAVSRASRPAATLSANTMR